MKEDEMEEDNYIEKIYNESEEDDEEYYYGNKKYKCLLC